MRTRWRSLVALVSLILLALCLSAAVIDSRGGADRQGTARAETPLARSFEFTYVVHVPALPRGSHTMRVWIPAPQTDTHQRVHNLRFMSPVPYRLYRERRFDGRSVYLRFDTARVRTPFDIRMTFRVRRYEYKVALPSSDPPPVGAAFPPNVARYLEPDRLVPINGIIGELSRKQTAGVSDPLAKARKIYDYVIRSMHYDHEGTGWGHGDAIYACSAHHGNCTDFHSLFIGMARAAGIPARFVIGFLLPPDQPTGKIGSYHCWAEFYVQGIGWIPIDAAEA